MRNRWTHLALVSTAALAASAAWAQAPTVVEPDQHYDGKLSSADPQLADGAPHACYAINTKAGDQIALTLHADKFLARLQVGRGPSCALAAFQFDKTGAQGKDAQVGFKAAGGRYVIAVRGATPEAAGAFRLNVEATLSVAGQPAPAAPGAQASAEPPSARKLAMLAQVDKRNAEIAAEQERQRKAAEEQRLADERMRETTRRLEEAVANMQAQQRAEAAAAEAEAEEASQPRVNPLAAFNSAFNQAMAENAAQRADQQRFLDNLAAQQRAANAAREARERAEQARQDAARREAARAEAERQQALSRQLAEANAYRNAQMANADAATRQRLEQQNRAAQQAAQSVGGGQAFQQRQAELDSAAAAQRAAEAQAQERQRRAEQQRAAEQQRVAEQQKLAEAQRRQQQAQAQATSSASASNPAAIIIAERPSAPPVPPVASPQPNKTPIPTASSSSLTCPAGRRRSTPEELMVEFKYGKTRAEAEAELNKKQSGLYNMQCAGNDFGWQCKANYKSGRMIEFCVGGPGQ